MKKDDQPPKYPPGLKPLTLKPVELKNLPKLKSDFDFPKAPPVYPNKDEVSQFKDKRVFSLNSMYNLETFSGRFKS